jgi:multidrug efflux pump subunit AcrA (membrane-fusion protein)
MIRRGFLSIVVFLALQPAVLRAAPPSGEVEAVSKPSADATLSFVKGGRVVQVSVKEGDTVSSGALLARQDDRMAVVELAQTNVDLKRFEEAKKKGAATEWEIEHTRLKHDQLKIEVELMRLVSPMDGRVEEVAIDPGEAAQPLTPVIRVVKTDPLWIDVPVPLGQARGLRPKMPARVSFPGKQQAVGHIVHVSAVADAASGTLRVRVEVPNPSRRPAGEQVTVSFGEGKGGGK